MPEQHLYRFWHDDELLYIGISANAYARAEQHARKSLWWPEVNRMTVEHYPDRGSVEAAEKQAILDERPRHNIRDNPAAQPRSRPARSLMPQPPARLADIPEGLSVVDWLVAQAPPLSTDQEVTLAGLLNTGRTAHQ